MLLRLQDALDTDVAANVLRNVIDSTSEELAAAASVLKQHIWEHPLFQLGVQPCRLTDPMFRKYEQNAASTSVMAPAVIGRCNEIRVDVGLIVFLNDRAEYGGGELVLEGPGGDEPAVCERGECVVYPAAVNRRFNPVETGTLWTCELWAQSLIPDAFQREILYDIGYSLQLLELFGSDLSNDVSRLRICHRNLLRLWATP